MAKGCMYVERRRRESWVVPHAEPQEGAPQETTVRGSDRRETAVRVDGRRDGRWEVGGFWSLVADGCVSVKKKKRTKMMASVERSEVN